jgi:hypothetical protein
MKSLQISFVVLATTGLLFLGACGNSNQAGNTENNPSASINNSFPISTTNTSASPTAKIDNERGTSKGGQVIETGAYHLEFIPGKESNGTHMDLYLQKGDNHQAIPNAKVTAEVQLPDGQQKTIPLTYDASGKHYTAVLADKATGQYQVRITADIGGEKVNGRFSFNR